MKVRYFLISLNFQNTLLIIWNTEFEHILLIYVADTFCWCQSHLLKLYQFVFISGVKSDKDTGLEEEKGKNENDLVAGLFQIKNRSTSGKSNKSKSLYHDMDSSRLVETELKQFDTEELTELIKDCFVTGKWSAAENAQQLLNDDDGKILMTIFFDS